MYERSSPTSCTKDWNGAATETSIVRWTSSGWVPIERRVGPRQAGSSPASRQVWTPLSEPHPPAGRQAPGGPVLPGRPADEVTYWIAPGRRIILFTVFAKAQRQERREVRRAKSAMERCAAEAHTIDEE